MIKSSALRIRVAPELHREFLSICTHLDVPAAQVLRQYMQQFVDQNRGNMQSNLFARTQNVGRKGKNNEKGKSGNTLINALIKILEAFNRILKLRNLTPLKQLSQQTAPLPKDLFSSVSACQEVAANISKRFDSAVFKQLGQRGESLSKSLLSIASPHRELHETIANISKRFDSAVFKQLGQQGESLSKSIFLLLAHIKKYLGQRSEYQSP